MRFSVEPRQGYLLAELAGRETAEDMRTFLQAVRDACRSHGCPRILMVVRQSRAVFKAEEYGFDGNAPGYVQDLVSSACQVALLGDSQELNAAHEYIEVVARQQKINARAFHDQAAAVRCLMGTPQPERRYRFTRVVISGAPDDAGVYALWEDNELVYYGRAMGSKTGATIRSRLLEHLAGSLGPHAQRVTHYSWEITRDPAGREAELLREHQSLYGRAPRYNAG
jgi:hypothetical protein